MLGWAKEYAIGPKAAPFEIVRVVANHIHDGLQDSQSKRLVVLRHEHGVTEPSIANLVNELDQVPSARQVDDGIRLEAVTVASPHNGQTRLTSQPNNMAILV